MIKSYIYLMDYLKGGCTAYYVGATTNPDKRFRDHLSALRRGRHTNPDIQHWFDVLGEECVRFQVLFEFEVGSVEDICAEEERWMRYAVELHGRDDVLNYYLKSHRGSFRNTFTWSVENN